MEPQPTSSFRQVRHEQPVRAVPEVRTEADLAAFDASLRRLVPDDVWDYVVEPAFEGIPVVIRYEEGRLVRAVTQGNGEIGDDVTDGIRACGWALHALADAPALMELRGMVCLTRDAFQEVNHQAEESGCGPFSDAADACRAALRAQMSAKSSRPSFDILVDTCCRVKGRTFATHAEMAGCFQRWGLKTAPWQRLCMDIPMAVAAIEELAAIRHTFPFAVRGAVIRMSRCEPADRVERAAGSSQAARIWVYPPVCAETRLVGVAARVGRTGVLMPVAELDPVPLADVTVHQAAMPEGVARDLLIGDRVRVLYAGDSLPVVSAVLTDRRDGTEQPFSPPTVCPACGEPVVRREGETVLRCGNLACPARRIGRLLQFVSVNGLDLPFITGEVARTLVEGGVVEDPLDLFALTPGRLAQLRLGSAPTEGESGARRDARDLLDALDAARRLPLHRWLYAVGIPEVGVKDADPIASLHPSFSALAASPVITGLIRLDALTARASEWAETLADPIQEAERQIRFNRLCGEIGVLGDELVAAGGAARIPGTALPPRYASAIRIEAARAVAAFFASDYGQCFAARLAALRIDPKRREPAQETGRLAHLIFVLTGTFSVPRETYSAKIMAAGGWVQAAVTPQTRYLVAGNGTDATKTRKARALGVEVIDEAELLALLLGNAIPVAPHPPAPEPPRRRPAKKKEKSADGFRQDELF